MHVTVIILYPYMNISSIYIILNRKKNKQKKHNASPSTIIVLFLFFLLIQIAIPTTRMITPIRTVVPAAATPMAIITLL